MYNNSKTKNTYKSHQNAFKSKNNKIAVYPILFCFNIPDFNSRCI